MKKYIIIYMFLKVQNIIFIYKKFKLKNKKNECGPKKIERFRKIKKGYFG